MRVLCLVSVFLLSACGGGGGGDDGATGSASVHVTDYFDQSVAGASVSLCGRQRCAGEASTDEEGNVTFEKFPAGPATLCASYPARGGGCEEIIILAGRTITVGFKLELGSLGRYGPGAVAVLNTRVATDGLGPDGRTLDIVIRVAVTNPPAVGSWFNADPVWIEDCVAREGQELIDAGPRCIRGADGSDASYSFSGLRSPPVRQTIREPAQPATVGLLIDQSAGFDQTRELVREAHLFTAKIFADRVLPETAMLLAAFAADDPASGLVSLLPQTPVTFLPVDDPGPFLSKAETFAELDGLAELGGGVAPLYESVLSSINFVASHAIPGTRRMLVVMANGRDDACGAPAPCAALRAEIASLARDKDVELVLKPGYGGDIYGDYYPESDGLKELAVDAAAPLIAGGALSYDVFNLVQDLVEGEVAVEDLRIRLTSDVPGAFHPGASVVGTLFGTTASDCPFGCQTYLLPFAVRVP